MGTAFAPFDREAVLARPRPDRALPIFTVVRSPRTRRSASPRVQDGAHRPILAVWEVTLRCDLSCRHCGSRAGRVRPNELTTAECLDLVHQLADLGTREVALIGGEAYLREDWLEIIAAIKASGMMPTMTTGGRGLTLERTQGAKRAGLRAVSVSIDGEEETHDRLRGVQGSHRSALEAFENLRAAGIPFSANTQINRLSVGELPLILERIAAAGAQAGSSSSPWPWGARADEPDVLLQPYDLVALFPVLDRLVERARARSRSTVVAGNNIGYFGPHEDALRGRTQKGHSAGCGAGRATIGIEADGAIKGCPSLATKAWAGGTVRDTPLRQIWQRSEPLRYTRDRTVADLWGYCATCYYADECRAGCTWTAEVLFGKPGNNPYCHHRALEMKRSGLRERLVPVSPAPGEPFDHGLFDLIVEPWEPAEDPAPTVASEP